MMAEKIHVEDRDFGVQIKPFCYTVYNVGIDPLSATWNYDYIYAKILFATVKASTRLSP